jgi:hypothetical protein
VNLFLQHLSSEIEQIQLNDIELVSLQVSRKMDKFQAFPPVVTWYQPKISNLLMDTAAPSFHIVFQVIGACHATQKEP